MKLNCPWTWSLLLAILVLSGCQRKADRAAADSAPSEILGPQYSAKNGLLVPEDTRQSLGLKIIEVAEQKIPLELALALRVYQNDSQRSLASGSIVLEQAKLLTAGLAVQATTADGKQFPGKISKVSDQTRQATGLAEVLVEFSNPAGLPPAGAFLEATIRLDANEKVVTIPRLALLECADGYSVYTVSGEHLVRATVKVGTMNEDVVEIKDGLYAGDQIVLEPVMSLWMTELAAVKGGQACCAMPAEGK